MMVMSLCAENGILWQELWSLLEFMLPDLFVTEDVDLKRLLTTDDRDLIARMKSILGPFILRRLKSDVMQQLVPKEHRVSLRADLHQYFTLILKFLVVFSQGFSSLFSHISFSLFILEV